MQATFARAGQGFEVFEADPLARRICRQHLQDLTEGSQVEGLSQLASVSGRLQVWVCNHLSYSDTQVLDALLALHGVKAVDDLLVVAGPKVYTDPYRRLATIGLSTLKTPQSTAVASEGAMVSARELARITVETQQLAAKWRLERGPVLIYPEGSRSPDGRLQAFLRGVNRWLRKPEDLVVVPLGQGGPEHLFARDERMRPRQVTLRFGVPFTVGEVAKGRHGPLEEAWHRVAALVPPQNAPTPETEPVR